MEAPDAARPPPKRRPALLLHWFLDAQPVVRRLHYSEVFGIVKMVEDMAELLPNVQDLVFQRLSLELRQLLVKEHPHGPFQIGQGVGDGLPSVVELEKRFRAGDAANLWASDSIAEGSFRSLLTKVPAFV